RGRQDGQVGAGEPQPRSQLTRALASSDDIGAGPDRYTHLIVALLPAAHQPLTQSRAQLALEQVPRRVDLSLAAAVAAGHGDEDRAAPVRRWLGLFQHQEVLDPQ